MKNEKKGAFIHYSTAVVLPGQTKKEKPIKTNQS
jgi:hypothetical protein